MQVRYTGPSSRAGLVAQILRDCGLTADYEPPIEERGGGEVAAVVVSFVVGSVASGATWDVIKATARAAVNKVRERLPGLEIELLDGDGESVENE